MPSIALSHGVIRVVALAIRISHQVRAMQSRCARGAACVGKTALGAVEAGHVLPALRLRDLSGKKRRTERAKIWSRIHMSYSRLTTAMGHRTTAILLETGDAAVTSVVGVVRAEEVWVPAIDIPSRPVLALIPVQINVAIRADKRAGKGKSAAMTVAREMTKTVALRSRIP